MVKLSSTITMKGISGLPAMRTSRIVNCYDSFSNGIFEKYASDGGDAKNYFFDDIDVGNDSNDDHDGGNDDDTQRLGKTNFDKDIVNSLVMHMVKDDALAFVTKLESLFGLDGYRECGKTQCPSFVMRWIISVSPMACATALLEGQIHGARADITNALTMEKNSLPLKKALEELRYHLYLCDWTAEDSIFKLVIILCLPQMKVALETIKLLALSTNDVDEIFIDYAKEGKVVEMVILLLVANEGIIAPCTLQSKDGAIVGGGTTIHDRRMGDNYVSMRNREGTSKLAEMCKDKRVTLLLTSSLLNLFERAAGAIRSYLQSQHRHVPKEGVVKNVASILKGAGFVLKEKDIDLSNIDCFGAESDEIKKVTGTSSESITAYKSKIYGTMVDYGLEKWHALRMKEPKEVAKDVTSILKEILVVFKGNDAALKDMDCKSNKIKEAAETSENTIADTSEDSFILPDPWKYGSIYAKLNPMSSVANMQVYPRSSTELPVNHGFRHFSSSAFVKLQKNQFMGKTTWHQRKLLSKSSALKSLPLLLKRGMRHV